MHNLVRNLFNQNRGTTSERRSHVSQEEELAITHLHKVYTNYKNGQHQLEPVLPLFCKAFTSARALEINEKFVEIADFAKCVSADFVDNITKSASSKSLEDGSLALLALLKGRQWHSLCAINIAALSLSAVKAMCSEHVPSTLVKVLYLFMDLPESAATDVETTENISKMLMSVVIRMGEHVCVVEELTQTDSDLLVLFDICSCWWSPHNRAWLNCAVEFMSTVCRKSLTQGIVEYLEKNECISSCVKNLRYMVDTNILCVADTILPLLCCLKDSCNISDRLLNNFKDSEGYVLLTDAIIGLDKIPAGDERTLRTKNDCLNKLIYSIPQLCTCGFDQHIPQIQAKCMQYQCKDFCIPTPNGKGASVKNPAVFAVLQNTFLECKSEQTSLLILDVINQVYRLDEVNYFILNQYDTLNCFITTRLLTGTTAVQERLLKMVEHVVFVLRYVPSSELETLAIMLKDRPDTALATMILATLNKLISANTRMKEVLLQLGLLNSLQFCQIEFLQKSHAGNEIDENYLMMLMTTLNTMLEDCYPAYTSYVELPAREYLYDMLHLPVLRAYVLHVIKTLSTYESINDEHDDVRSLLRMIQENPTDTDLKLDILECLRALFVSFPLSQYRFQKANGFLFISNLILSAEEFDKGEHIHVIGRVLELLQAALHENPANMHYFATQIQYSSLTESLRLLPCFSPCIGVPNREKTVLEVLKFLMTLALDLHQDLVPTDTVIVTKRDYLALDMEYFDQNIVYPQVILSILTLAYITKSDTVLNTICEWIMQMSLDQHNLELLCGAGFITSLLELFPEVFSNPGHSAYIRVVSLFEVLARHRLTPHELRNFLRLESPLYCKRPEQTRPRLILDRQTSTGDQVDIENGELIVTPSSHDDFATDVDSSKTDTVEPEDIVVQTDSADTTSQTSKNESDNTESDSQPFSEKEINKTELIDALKDEDHVLKQTAVHRVQFEEGKLDDDNISRTSLSEEFEDTSYFEDNKTSPPVIISFEEIERLKTELAINFSGFPDHELGGDGKGGMSDEEEENWGVEEPQFEVTTISKHHIELLVSISTPIDGDLESVSFLRIAEGSTNAGLIIPYLIKPGSVGSDKLLQSSFCVALWYQIPKVRHNQAWEVNILHHKNLNLNLLPGLINISTGEVMNTHDAKFVKDDSEWHFLVVSFHKGAKIRHSAAEITIDNHKQPTIRTEFPILLEQGPLLVGMNPGQKSLLSWKLGSVYVFDGALTQSELDTIFLLGPSYVGNFRSRDNITTPILNISPRKYGTVMLDKIIADIKDCDTTKLLMAQEFVREDQTADTPFKVFPNLSFHLSSQESSPCAISLYHTQCIAPCDIGSTFGAIGSVHVLLGLIAMVSDSEGLYAAIKVLTLVVNNNTRLQQDMETGGYEILALLIHRKAQTTSTHVLQLVASLGAVSGAIKFPTAVRVLLCCFEIWRRAPVEIQIQLFTCIYNLVINPHNNDQLNEMGLPRKLLEFIFDTTVEWCLVQSALDVVSAVLSTCSSTVLHTLGNYIVYTLPSSLSNEHALKEVSHTIRVRNMLLELLCVLVQSSDMNNDSKLRLQIEQTLGFDWVLLFLRPGLHHITFTMGLRLIGILISPTNGFSRFSQKVNHGGWLISSNVLLSRQETNDSIPQGFPLLLHALKGHTRIPEFPSYSYKVYTWLISLTLNQSSPPNLLSGQFNKASLVKVFSEEKCKIVNKDPLVVLISIVRDDLNEESFTAVVNYLQHLHSSDPNLHSVFISIIEPIIALLWVPYLDHADDLLIKRKPVLDLLRQIILSELFQQNFDILDIVFEPSLVEFDEHLAEYQRVLLHHTLRDIQNGAPDGVTSKNFNKAAIFFSKYILQKLWEGKLGNSAHLLDSFLQLTEWISKEAECAIVYCLHRAILYYLSRQNDTVDTQRTILKVIHIVTENHRVIFKPDMCDYEFVICLSHLLRSVSTEGEWGRLIEEAIKTLLNFMEELRPDLCIYIEPSGEIPLHNVTKTNKSSLSSLFSGTEDTNIVIQHEIAPKLFAQIKMQQEDGDKSLHQQRSSRRFTGLLTARRQEAQLTISPTTALNTSCDINYAHTTNVMCHVSDQIKEAVHSTQLQFHRIHTRWDDIQLHLTQERGLWGPEEPSHLDRWMLDHIEGPHRTRKRFKLNTDFYKIFQPKSLADYHLSKFKQPSSSYSKEYYHYYGTRDRVSSLATIGGASPISQTISARTLDADNRLMQDFLLPGEQKLHVFPCLRVQELKTIASLLYLGRKSAYIIDGYTLTTRDDIMDVQMLMPEEWCRRFSDILVESNAVETKQRESHSLNYKRITEIVKRRYSLQENGMEIFSNGGESYFLVFGSNHRNKAYHKLRYLTPSLTPKSDFASDVLSSARRHTRDTGSLFSNFRQSNVSHRWETGEITNFQYLMYLNTLAGRSYNDLMQYPIFPWVLADYQSTELDLNNPKTFRDLSKPMGAQTPDRLAQFEKRYNDWIDPHGTDTNPCHYGTFYSSAMITSSYLIRVEPFTSSFITLQGGHFDLADRLFYSIKDAWRSASEINMCDVRELIPEFFYLPEFLVNRNSFDLGKKQNGEKIQDVYLPTWAKGDPAEFIRLHREALESDYVSANLHNWIDLIFGYKQRGPPAQAASNTFHCYFYEGAIDLSTLDDPLRKSAVKGFINNFGQAPKQIFSRPHPARSARYSDMVKRTFHYNVVSLKPPQKEERVIASPVQQIESTENGGLLFAGKNKVLVPSASGYNYYFTWGLPDNSLLLGAVDGKIVQVYEDLDRQIITCVICPDSEHVITGGQFSYISVWSHNLSKTKDTTLTLKKRLFGHCELVSCLASSDNHRVFVSGSTDKTVILWDLNKLTFIRQLLKHPHRITTVSINDVSGEIITASCNCLYLWSINGALLARTDLASGPSLVIQVVTQTSQNEWDSNNVLVTGSNDGIVRIWGIIYQRIAQDASSRFTMTTQDSGHVTTTKQWERRFVMRSRLTMHTSYERSDNKHPAEITCLRFSDDHVNLYVGDARGRVYCWSPDDMGGKQADHWVQDSGTKECSKCRVRFTFVERRHHCRLCGQVFCNNCTNFYKPILSHNILHKVRVCKSCFNMLPDD